MLKIREYARPRTLDEAYRLCTGKKNAVIGGMLWLKMQDKAVNTAIDLQDLGLDKIEKTESGWRIGAMVTLRDLELSAELDALTGGAVKESVRHIVGVQFRNLATVGGSLWGRYGFSDVLTLFMALDAKAELYSRGIVDIETFAEMPTSEKDLLLSVTIPYDCGSCASQCEHTPMEELTALMQYMVGHNAAHARELAELASQLEKNGNHVAYEQVMAAVSDFEKGNLRLSAVLASLKG